MLSLEAAQKEFGPAGVYLNTASIGLPPRRAIAALDEVIETWRTGRADELRICDCLRFDGDRLRDREPDRWTASRTRPGNGK